MKSRRVSVLQILNSYVTTAYQKNQSRRSSNNLKKKFQLQEGFIIKSGYLTKSPPPQKMNNKMYSWKSRWIVLYDDRRPDESSENTVCLYYFDDEEAMKNGCPPIKTIDLHNANINSHQCLHTEFEFAFVIHTDNRVWHFCVNDQQVQSDWIKVLQKHATSIPETHTADEIPPLNECIPTPKQLLPKKNDTSFNLASSFLFSSTPLDERAPIDESSFDLTPSDSPEERRQKKVSTTSSHLRDQLLEQRAQRSSTASDSDSGIFRTNSESSTTSTCTNRQSVLLTDKIDDDEIFGRYLNNFRGPRLANTVHNSTSTNNRSRSMVDLLAPVVDTLKLNANTPAVTPTERRFSTSERHQCDAESYPVHTLR